jgi:hypothetical protein
MKRRLSALATLALVAALAGCAMCQSPFDYCGPVAGPDGCQSCNFNARRGSMFEPMDGGGGEMQMQMAPTLAPSAADAAEYPAGDEVEAVDYEQSTSPSE